MREIKFKVWDKEDKQISTPFGFTDNVVTFYRCINIASLEFVANKKERFEFLQFTGLKDKNKVQIFEGDLFKFKIKLPEGAPVGLLGSFSFGSDLSFEIDVHNDPSFVCLHFIDDGRFSDFEVIGNIFDNADLIK